LISVPLIGESGAKATFRRTCSLFWEVSAPQFGFFFGEQSANHLPLGFVLLVLKKPTEVFDVEVCHHFFEGGNT